MNDQDQELVALLGQMNQWWENNPYHSVRIDTVGRYMDTTSTMYYYLDANNRRRYRGETRTKLPFESHFRFQVIDGVSYMDFPESGIYLANGSVIVYEAFVQATLGDLTQVNVLLNASKERSLRERNGNKEIVLIMDPKKLGVGPANADISLVIRYDARPQFTHMEQTRMGLVQNTTFTLLSTNQAEVLAALPKFAPTEQARQDFNFDEALKKDILYYRTLRSQGA